MGGIRNVLNLFFNRLRGLFGLTGTESPAYAAHVRWIWEERWPKRRIDLKRELAGELEASMEAAQWIRVRKKDGREQVFPGNELTSKQAAQLIDDTLKRRYVYFAMDFMFQGEGVYVKRLKKTVYRSFHATLVLHQGAGNMACLFFAGDSMCTYGLIGDLHAYCEVDSKEIRRLPVGDAMLPEYLVLHRRGEIDKALFMLFSDLENADRRLEQSHRWSADIAFPGGVNNYNRRRRELGLLEDSCGIG